MNPLWLAVRLPESSPPSDLACWAGQFTPRVSIADEALLLEIGGCLRLFHGLDALHARVTKGLAELDVAARTAVAATPQAAIWLAEGQGDSLDALAIPDLTWPAGVAEKLTRFGLRRLGELRRLTSPQGAGRHEVAVPSNARDGATPHTFAALARRIGKPAATMIARAYGEAPDPRVDFVFPLRFGQEIELPAAVENAPVLMFAARRLTGALAGWLNVRQAGLRECRLDLVHRQGATPLPLRFAEPTRDATRFERVLRERLERLQLAAPVERLRLVVESVEDLPGSSGGLFDDGKAKESMAALVERLRARLGEERVYGIAPVADHRPECATRQVSVGVAASAATPPRPLWLLEKPESLAEVAGRPHRRGPLRLLAGPERIESGWWQEGEMSEEGVGDVRRDYFIALTQDQRWAWVFRELKAPGGWFLHGWFG